nr:hypothetical protein [Amylibacter sp.]
MLDLVSLIKSVVQNELASQQPSAFGVVDSLHLPDAAGLNQYACDVRLQGSTAVYQKVPISSSYLGQLAPLMVGDVVVLQFIGGDPDAPVISGVMFSETVPAPEMAAGERLIRLPHSADAAEQIEMRQTAGTNGSRIWRVTLPEGPELQMTDTSIAAQLDDFALTLDGDADTATLTSGGVTFTLDGSGNATLSADGDITFEAGGNLILKSSANTEIKASGTMALKASKIDLN